MLLVITQLTDSVTMELYVVFTCNLGKVYGGRIAWAFLCVLYYFVLLGEQGFLLGSTSLKTNLNFFFTYLSCLFSLKFIAIGGLHAILPRMPMDTSCNVEKQQKENVGIGHHC